MGRQFPSATRQQRVILDAIEFFLRKGEVPTIREIGSLVGLRSPATVLKHLRALQKDGLISLSGKSRGIRLTRLGSLASGVFSEVSARVSGEDRARSGPHSPTLPACAERASGEDASTEDRSRDTSSETATPPSKESISPAVSWGAVFPGEVPLRGRPSRGIPLVGAIAAGRPFESYPDGFSSAFFSDGFGSTGTRRDEALGDDVFFEQGGDVLSSGGVTLGGAVARSGEPDGFSPSSRAGTAHLGDGSYRESEGGPESEQEGNGLPMDPRMFVESGEVFALRVEGDSMINAGILDGDHVIIRRQNTVEEGEIAAVIINGEGTLKRWHVVSSTGSTTDSRGCSGDEASGASPGQKKHVCLHPANERFDPIEITEEDAKEVLVFGKYVGLVRGNLRML